MPSAAEAYRAALISRVSGLSADAGSSVRSITPTVWACRRTSASWAAGNGRKVVTVTQPTARPSSRSRSTTASAVSAMVPMATTIWSASSQRCARMSA